MTQDERAKVGEFWLGLAQMYGKELGRAALKIMLDSIDELDAGDVLQVFNEWSRTSKQNRHPLPAEVHSLAKKELSSEAMSNEAANRIRMAIVKFGYNNPADAKEFMGSLAWAVVVRFGGWEYICENHGVLLSPLTFHAQARDSAKSILENAALGQLDKPVQIPAPNEPRKQIGLAKFDTKTLIIKK